MSKQFSDILVGLSIEDENAIVNAANNYSRILKIFYDALISKGFDEAMAQNMTIQYMNLINFNSIGGTVEMEDDQNTVVITPEELQQIIEEEAQEDPLRAAKGIGLGVVLGTVFWGIVGLIIWWVMK